MLSRVDASELALQLHHYLDGLNDEAVRDFAVVFGARLPPETRSLFFTTLDKPLECDLRSTLRGAEAQRLKFAMSSVLWADQSAAEAIPQLVQQSMASYRAFVIADEFVEDQPRQRPVLLYAGIALVVVLALFLIAVPVRRAAAGHSGVHGVQNHPPHAAARHPAQRTRGRR